MTKKITKALITLGFFSVGIASFIRGDMIRGIMMIALAIAGMYWVEYREAMRYFDSITKRIFVCVDFEAAYDLVENLSKQMLFQGISKELGSVTKQIIRYYEGDFTQVVKPKTKYSIKRFMRWSEYISNQARYELQGNIMPMDLSQIEKNAKKSHDLLEIRQYELLILKSQGAPLASIESMRLKDNPNLITAELCNLMAAKSESPNRKTIYKQSATNLAPGTYFSL